ncbi:hypothetical protein GQ42DRAFT_105806, partial [Ramicandelaber brevisporus]
NVDDPSDWPVQQPHLRLLDQSLRCPICKDVYNSAMYLPTCTHAFCSLCVRRALQTEAKCPVCRVNAQESMLKKCGWLDDAAFHFKKARAELLPILKQHYNRSGNNASSRSQSNLPRSTATPAPTATTAPTTSRMTTRSQSAASNSASSAPQGRRAKMVIIDTDDEDQSTTQKTVECPICNKYIYESAINAHIDKCLKNQGNADDDGGNNLSSMSISTTITKNQPKPTKLVYSVLTEKRLREVLKELQLPAHGDRQTMQQRHQEFVNIYNANQDSREPRSYKQLVSDLTHWE